MEKPVFNNTPNECVKTEDGRTVFLSRSPAIAIPVMAMDSEDQLYVLLSRRGTGTPDFKHHYNFVCGYVDYDETVQGAVKRELWEEVGLNVDAIPDKNVIYGIQDLPWAMNSTPDNSKQNITLRFGLFLQYETEDELPSLSTEYCEPNEVSEVVWVTVEEALNILPSNSKADPLKEKVWAFNHYDVCREWLDLVTDMQ